MTKPLLSILSLALLGGCSFPKPDEAFVKAAEAYHQTMAVAVIPLCDDDAANDPDLTGVNGQALIQAHEAYALAIEAAKQALAGDN